MRFVTDLRVPPTSNQAERDLRPAKTQIKISGRLTSVKAIEARYAVKGYQSTAAKHGVNLFTVLRDAIIGRAMDPRPSPTMATRTSGRPHPARAGHPTTRTPPNAPAHQPLPSVSTHNRRNFLLNFALCWAHRNASMSKVMVESH